MALRLPGSQMALCAAAVVVVAVFSSSSAHADTASSDNATSAASAAGAAGAAGMPSPTSSDPPAATFNEAKVARMEMDAAIARMQSTSRQVRTMLRDVRRRGTKRQITCVDEALSRVDVAHRSARDQESEALAAYARNDLDAARASRVRIAELDEAHRLAARDGAACVPQSIVISQKQLASTIVRVVIDPRIAPEQR